MISLLLLPPPLLLLPLPFRRPPRLDDRCVRACVCVCACVVPIFGKICGPAADRLRTGCGPTADRLRTGCGPDRDRLRKNPETLD